MKLSILTISLVLGLGASAPAVAGPFEKFFEPASPAQLDLVLPASEPVQIYVSRSLDDDARKLLEDGYEVVGISDFVGPMAEPKKAMRQAKKIKAAIVLFASSYNSTRSGAAPFMMPNNTTTTINGNVSGSAGWGSYGGTATTTRNTPMMVPFSVDRYNQTAIFFSKIDPKKFGFGLQFDTLDPAQARQIGTNKGLVVKIVRRNSPAFNADVLPGDIVLKVAGFEMTDVERLTKIKSDFAGKSVAIEILRDGQAKTLEILVPSLATAVEKGPSQR